jgi:zinc-binding alcohol dehydrogenase/oxidoreductase
VFTFAPLPFFDNFLYSEKSSAGRLKGLSNYYFSVYRFVLSINLCIKPLAMKALVLTESGKNVSFQEVSKPELSKNQVLIRIHSAALNHRDVYITQGLYPGVTVPVILGSDGCGEVVEVAEGVDKSWLKKSVIINPGTGWNNNPVVQPKDYRILGMPDNGCFAEYIAVDEEQIAEKPEHLSWQQAAAMPLAGLTAYRSLISRAGIKKSDRVLISGVGGGVALFACQIAIAKGAEVFVTSSSEQKIKKAIALGAKGGANYKEENWHKSLKKSAGGGFDLIIDSAGGDGFKYFLDLANMGGRIVFYGGTRGSFKVNPQKMFWKQLSVFGSTMGNNEEFSSMVSFVNEHKLIPVVDSIWSLEKGTEAFEHMNQGKQFGKIIIDIT